MSKLSEYLYSQYNLVLLESEVNDILELARQEIELPSQEEIESKYPTSGLVIAEGGRFKGCATIEMWSNAVAQEGIKWALNKVRNPYPKPM